MFAGHVGVALAVGRVERRVNLGVFVAAALLLDILLWLFVLLGWESARIPSDFSITHQPAFVFPFSHGLSAGVAWSALAGTLVFLLYSRRKEVRWRASLLVAAAVFSHWMLDALVHRPELPVAGAASHLVGVGLWNVMPVALVVEAALVGVGMYLFLPASGLSRGKRLSLGALSLFVLAFTVVGMTVTPPPPSAAAMAISSLVAILTVCLLIGWLGKGPREKEA